MDDKIKELLFSQTNLLKVMQLHKAQIEALGFSFGTLASYLRDKNLVNPHELCEAIKGTAKHLPPNVADHDIVVQTMFRMADGLVEDVKHAPPISLN